MSEHSQIDRWSLLMHRVLADRIEQGDAVPERTARANLARWRDSQGELSPAQAEWLPILDGPLTRLLAVLRDSEDQEAVRLRGTSPFAGALDQTLRIELFHEARAA